MSAPTFGDPTAIARYTVKPDHVYELYELIEMETCPPGLRRAYDDAMGALDNVTSRGDPTLPVLWDAMSHAEATLRLWGERQGYRVSRYGMRDDEGKL